MSLPDLAATQALARRLAPLLRRGDCLALFGDLGAGKTSFARALLQALPGLPGSESEAVPSPTFTLLQHYERDLGLITHADLYRLERASEAEELGLWEAASDGLLLIEWPERLGEALRGDALRLTFTFEGEGRRLALQGDSAWSQRLQSLLTSLLESPA